MRGEDERRLVAIEDAIDRLRLEAEDGTVVVEGSHDLAALEWLGIGGRHVALHQGRPMDGVLEQLASCPPPLILLLDWDRTGGRLFARVEQSLRARVRVDGHLRRLLATSCRSRSLEEVPAELSSLRRKAMGRPHGHPW